MHHLSFGASVVCFGASQIKFIFLYFYLFISFYIFFFIFFFSCVTSFYFLFLLCIFRSEARLGLPKKIVKFNIFYPVLEHTSVSKGLACVA